MSGGWARDTRNDILYPTFGRLQSFLAEIGLPFGDLAYYKLNYLNQSFWPVYGELVLMLKADLGYGDGYDDKPFPFFKAFYAGGVGSVRGYEAGTLGPRDIYGNTLGGKRKIVGNAEMSYPLLKGDKSVRIGGFFDAGQIYVNGYAARIRELPLFRRALPSPGIRRSDRSSSAMRSRSIRFRPTRSSTSSSRWARASSARRMPQEIILKQLAHSLPPLVFCCRRRRRGRRRLQDRLRQRRTAVARFGARQARAAEAGEGIRAARSRAAEAGQAGARPAGRRSTRTARRWARPSGATRSATSPTSRATCSGWSGEFREDVNLRRAEELAAVQERANKILMQIAEAEKFDLILQDPVVFASQKIDITEKVIKALADK